MPSNRRNDKAANLCLAVVLCIMGLGLFLRSTILLIRNETRNILRITDLQEGRDSVTEFDPYNNNFTSMTNNNSIVDVDHSNSDMDTSSSSLDGQLIYVVGNLSTTDQFIDTLFGVAAARYDNNIANIASALATFSFLKIQRFVQMYQWHEYMVEGPNGGRSYRYDKQWLSYYSDSSCFVKQSSSRKNPKFPFQSLTFIADPINFGNTFDLTDNATLAALNWYEPLNTISIDDVPNGTAIQLSKLTKYIPNGFLYSQSSSNHPDQPNIGDVHVTWDVIRPSTISVVAQFHRALTNQNGNSTSRHNLGPYTTHSGGTILMVQNGFWTVDELFQTEAHIQNTKVWKYRRNGFIWMCVAMIFVVFMSFYFPYVSDMVECRIQGLKPLLHCSMIVALFFLVVALVCMLLALPICIYIIAFAYVAFRPKIAVPVVVSMSFISMTTYTYYWYLGNRKKRQVLNTVGVEL
jgi:hypothetical protein